MTIIEMLCERVESSPDGVAFILGEERFTYRQLSDASERLGRMLNARGIQPGDRIVLQMTNVREMIVAYYACFRLGAIACPLHVRLKTAELRPLLQRLQPTLYIGQAEFHSAVAAIEPNILRADARVVVGGVFEDGRALRWEDFVRHEERPIMVSPDVDAPAVLLMTSGTTGVPKFVTHTQATLLAAIATTVSNLAFDAERAVLHTTTMAHVSGLLVMLASIGRGVRMILLPTFDPEAALDAIQLYRCSFTFNLPFMYAELIRCQRARSRNVGSLRTCLVGGDVCPSELQQTFEDVFGVPLRNVWGSTETIVPLTYGFHPGPVMRVVPSANVRLINDAGLPVSRGELGELLIRAPGLAAGYWAGPGQVESLLKDGWFHTGDLMQQGDGDDIWFVSRKKELLVRGGDNISPVEVEQVLLAHPAVRDAAVTGVPDAILGQRVVALVQLEGDVGEAVFDDIRASVLAQLAYYKVPERMQAVAAIPRNTLGKIDRRALTGMVSVMEPRKPATSTKDKGNNEGET